MSETIIVGNEPIQRTVVGAISRLELITAKHAPSARADVDFLRARFNEVEAQRDEAIEELRKTIALYDGEINSEYGGTSMLVSRLAKAESARAVLAKVGG